MILASVNDQDSSIRMRALDLISAMVRIVLKMKPPFHTIMPFLFRQTATIYSLLSNNSSPILFEMTLLFYLRPLKL